MAVLTALTSMGGRQVSIFSDALNHASIIDGARLACRGGRASLHIYHHNDMAHLEQPPFRGDARRALPQGASLMVRAFHTFAHTRPPAHSHHLKLSDLGCPQNKTW
eukprot:1160123-Pelagomonas_calceolata.AAC.3